MTPRAKAWAKLLALADEEFPFACPGCGGDIRLIAFITDPGPIRKILTPPGEPLEAPPVSPACGPPTDWGELVQVHDDRAAVQATERRAARDRHPQRVTRVGRKAPKPLDRQTGSRSAPLTLHKFVHGDGESRHDVPPMKPLAFTARDYPIGAAVDMPRAGARIDDEYKLPAGGFTS